MAFTKSIVTTAALMAAKSSKILSSFLKTKEELVSMNKSLDAGIAENNTQIEYLNNEVNQMAALKSQHERVIQNIDALLGN